MTSGRIPTGTIVLLLLLKVGHPLMDTYTGIMWLNTLVNFGNEWSYFNVPFYHVFVLFTEDCKEAQYCDGNYQDSNCDGNWINKTVNCQVSQILKASRKGVSKVKAINKTIDCLLREEERAEVEHAFRVITIETGNKEARCKKDYIDWFLISLLPVLICGLLTLLVWWREEDGWSKVLLLPVVFIGLYSQYKALKIILIGLGKWPKRRMEDWKKEKGNFSRRIASIGTIYNAIPSLLILVALLASENLSLFIGKRPNPLIDNNLALFFTKFGISLLLTVMGLTLMLKDGPGPFISSKQGYLDGFISWDFLALFLSIFTWFFAKSLILFGIIAPQGHSSIAGIGLFKSTPVQTIFWVSTLILPQYLHAIIVLATSTGWKVFSFIISFPSFIITPLFTPFTYKGSCSDGTFEFQISIKHTMINILLTFLLTPLTMVLYYAELIWENLYNFGLSSQQRSDVQLGIKQLQESPLTSHAALTKFQDLADDSTKCLQVYLAIIVIGPYIVLVLSLLPTCYLLNNSFRGKHSANLKFCKTGRFEWKILSDEYDALENVADHGAVLQDQQDTIIVENNMDLPNNENLENVEENLDHDEGENNLEIQIHENHESQEDGPEQMK